MGLKCFSDNRDLNERDLSMSIVGTETYSNYHEEDDYEQRKEYFDTNHYDFGKTFFIQQSKKDFVNESDFLKYSKTGDILLYQTNNFVSKMIRTATQSKYDHVAMVVKNLYPSVSRPDKVYIFESVSDDGVRVTDWASIKNDIGPDKFYNKVVYRSVDFKRSKNQAQLLKFLKDNTGKNYGLNILNKMTKSKSESTMNGTSSEQEDFFCSELIAQAFKMAGVLKDDGSSSYGFTPNSFSMKGQSKLNLTSNTRIHREREIFLDNYAYCDIRQQQITSESPESQGEQLGQ